MCAWVTLGMFVGKVFRLPVLHNTYKLGMYVGKVFKLPVLHYICNSIRSLPYNRGLYTARFIFLYRYRIGVYRKTVGNYKTGCSKVPLETGENL